MYFNYTTVSYFPVVLKPKIRLYYWNIYVPHSQAEASDTCDFVIPKAIMI